MAVPCWSSWNTGMLRRSFNASSISKQRGAAMLLQINASKSRCDADHCLGVSLGAPGVSRQMGNALTPPNSLNSTALPSMTSMAARGPILPSPRTALPSDTTAMVLDLIVYKYAASGSFAITLHGSATPGVGQSQKSSWMPPLLLILFPVSFPFFGASMLFLAWLS